MTSIFDTLKKIQRLPRHHRISFLRSILKLTPKRSVRYVELSVALRREVLAQLKKEVRDHRTTVAPDLGNGHRSPEYAA